LSLFSPPSFPFSVFFPIHRTPYPYPLSFAIPFFLLETLLLNAHLFYTFPHSLSFFLNDSFPHFTLIPCFLNQSDFIFTSTKSNLLLFFNTDHNPPPTRQPTNQQLHHQQT
jgi:hypothetical protein